MISCINSLPAGRAVGVYLNPPSTAVKWRLIRNTADEFLSGENSLGLIYEGNERFFSDIAGLVNGERVWYKPYYFNGSTWETFPSVSIVPGMTMVDRSVDAQSLIRDRIDYSLNGLVGQGVLSHPDGIVPVLTESPQIENINMPCVTVHLQNDSDESRFLGDTFHSDIDKTGDMVVEIEGYYSRVSFEIVIWAKNGDERLAYRKALKTTLLSNTRIFSDFEIEEPHYSFTDNEEFDLYQFPLFMTVCTFTCLVPSVATGLYPPVSDITIKQASFFNDATYTLRSEN